MFPLIFVNTNSLINREQFPSQHPSLFFFKVIPVNRGLRWMQAGLDQCCSLCHDVLGELNGVDQFIWKSENENTFQAPRVLSLKHLTAFDYVWLRLTSFRSGECNPTWHNMTQPCLKMFEVDSRIALWCVYISPLATSCRRRSSRKWQSGCQQWLGLWTVGLTWWSWYDGTATIRNI